MNVYEAAQERLAIIFNDFDNVLVAFSCGKDSGVLLNLTYEYAVKTGNLHKLSFYYEDYEAGYKYTHEYAERTFATMSDVANRYWLCLPISAACSVSMYEPRWIPWDNDKKDIWVRPMPEGDYVINEHNTPFPFIKGTKGFDTRLMFAEWFSSQHGNTAVLIGIRADESLTRLGIFTSPHRRYMHKGLTYSKTIDDCTTNFYPIYDWKAKDIWACNARYQFDYNKIYDLYYQAGLTIDMMRVASPFHQCGQESLKLYRVIDPYMWGKMVGRVNGCNFGGIYGGTSAMGWRNITKPKHFTWKQYAEFLHLRELCADHANYDEIFEFIEAAENEYGDKLQELKHAKKEIKDFEDEQEETIDMEVVNLGLDTLHYGLENGNLKITSQLETWINQVKKQNCAGVEMF